MNFGDYLNKYLSVQGLTWREHYLTYIPWKNRNGQKLTGIVDHTEGVALDKPIPGTADRENYNYFNNPANQANSHCGILFSGTIVLHIAVEHGCWTNGNDNDNVQTFTFELQDNGRWNNPATYTENQYKAVAALHCALYDLTRDPSFANKSTPILFEHSKRGVRPHREISPGRACPGSFDWERGIRDAQALWNRVNNPTPVPPPVDEYKRVFFDGQQRGAFLNDDEAFDFWYTNKSKPDIRVTYKNENITSKYIDMANVLEQQLEAQKTNFEQQMKDKEDAFNEHVKNIHTNYLNKIGVKDKTIENLQTIVDEFDTYKESLIFKVYEFIQKNKDKIIKFLSNLLPKK